MSTNSGQKDRASVIHSSTLTISPPRSPFQIEEERKHESNARGISQYNSFSPSSYVFSYRGRIANETRNSCRSELVVVGEKKGKNGLIPEDHACSPMWNGTLHPLVLMPSQIRTWYEALATQGHPLCLALGFPVFPASEIKVFQQTLFFSIYFELLEGIEAIVPKSWKVSPRP